METFIHVALLFFEIVGIKGDATSLPAEQVPGSVCTELLGKLSVKTLRTEDLPRTALSKQHKLLMALLLINCDGDGG